MLKDANLPGVWRQDARQQTQKRGFARAIRTDKRRHASRGNLQRNILERVSTGCPFSEGLTKVPNHNGIHVSLSRRDARRSHAEDYC